MLLKKGLLRSTVDELEVLSDIGVALLFLDVRQPVQWV